MGDMADFTNEQGEDEYEHYIKYRDASPAKQYEEGLIDETGAPITSVRRTRIFGPGKCPICGAKTAMTNGKFGPFYGCTKFPDCKGSRSYK